MQQAVGTAADLIDALEHKRQPRARSATLSPFASFDSDLENGAVWIATDMLVVARMVDSTTLTISGLLALQIMTLSAYTSDLL